MSTAALASPPPATLEPSREFVFADADFERVRRLIRERAGISLHEGKRAMVYSRLSRRLRETGHHSFSAYLQALDQGDPQEWQRFVNALTTNLTAFFRESHHFDILAREVAARRANFSAQRPLRLWCNAASTGEEPYSLAITLLEALGSPSMARILATDIDTEVLDTARRGVYSLEGIRGLTPERQKRFFLRGTGPNAGKVRVKPELQSMIEFRSFNLNQSHWSFPEPFDVVFCRNVMIYFEADTQREMLARMHAVMKPGALLFVGHSENFSDARHLFGLKGKTVYDRR